MSAKIYTFTHWVDDFQEKQAEFLHLPLKINSSNDFYTIGRYDLNFELDWVVLCLSNTDAIPYYVYFDKNCNLRTMYFDCIRALGLTEMWVFNENMYDCLCDDEYSLENAIDKMLEGYNSSCPEFSLEECDKEILESIYHDSFQDLFDEVERIESKYNVKVLGLLWHIDENGNKLIRCLKNNEVHSLNLTTGELILGDFMQNGQ